MDLAVLGVGVGSATLGVADRPSVRDVILDTTTLASSLSPNQIHQLSQAHHLVADYGNDTSSSSMSIDGSTRSESAADGSTNSFVGDGNVPGELSGSSAMELDDTSFNGLFCFSALGPHVPTTTNVQENTSQPPPQPSASISTLPLLPLLQGSETITPAHVNTGPSILESISSSEDHLLELQYPPESPSLMKPFGSLSDFQALSASALDEDYLPAADAARTTIEDMDISLVQQGNDVVFDCGESITEDRQLKSLVLSGALGETYRSANVNGYVSTSDSSFGMGHSRGYRDATVDSSCHHEASGTPSSVSSYLPSSIELSVPPSLSPMMLHYDSQRRVMIDVSGEVGNTTEDGEGFSFALNRLERVGGVDPSSFLSGMRSREQGIGNANVGIEPTTVLRRAGFAASTVPSVNGRPGQGSRRGLARPAPIQYTSVPIPLPIPTRSRPSLLKGWQGEGERNLVSFGDNGKEHQTAATPLEVQIGQREGKKRKRPMESESDDDYDEERRKSASLRREMLGLRAISRESSLFSALDGDAPSKERDRKRRRVGSLSIVDLTSSKGKEKEITADWDESDEESESDSDDDFYYPSRSSSPAFGNYGSSSRALSSSGTTSSNRRSGSAQTVTTATTSMSSAYDDDDGEEHKQRKRNRGKAKGSAALALAKVTMLSGKPATSPWGTYVPFPVEENQDGQDFIHEDDAEIRAGRRRRNGHIPLPVPVPHLIKKSRGRKVPYVAKDVTSQGGNSGGNSGGSSRRRNEGEQWKRMFVCEVSGCGKCFVRGEHLKRHVRSIHTHDKPHPCPYEGCDKSFSRRDNLGQHVRIHLTSNN